MMKMEHALTSKRRRTRLDMEVVDLEATDLAWTATEAPDLGTTARDGALADPEVSPEAEAVDKCLETAEEAGQTALTEAPLTVAPTHTTTVAS